ncbi:MAG TPA: hypothetical protein VEZ47_08255 [Gemmatirosa sp.]|nr:hypothetical protein [Gemmatirosa sp.]
MPQESMLWLAWVRVPLALLFFAIGLYVFRHDRLLRLAVGFMAFAMSMGAVHELRQVTGVEASPPRWAQVTEMTFELLAVALAVLGSLQALRRRRRGAAGPGATQAPST